MSVNTKEYVMGLLSSYQQREREISVLRFELEHPARITEEEKIGAMTFAQGDGTGRIPGHISNKTLYIALNYKEQAERVNAEVIDEIAERLLKLEREQARLNYYVSLLDERQAEVICLSYFKKRPKEAVAKQLGISPRTVHDIKTAAINALAEMYELTSHLH